MEWIEVPQDWRTVSYLNIEKDCELYHSSAARWLDFMQEHRWAIEVDYAEVDSIIFNTEDEECDPDDVTEVY